MQNNQSEFVRPSVPQLVEEIPFELDCDGEIIKFTELRVKKELFIAAPMMKEFNIVNKQVMQNTGLASLSQINIDKIEAYSLHVETFASNTALKKITLRACLISDKGQRVIDTLISPPSCCLSQSNKNRLVFKDPVKTKLVALAIAKGPQMSQVQTVFKYLMRDKKIVAYHIPIKLQDIGFINMFAGPLDFGGMSSAAALVKSKFAQDMGKK